MFNSPQALGNHAEVERLATSAPTTTGNYGRQAETPRGNVAMSWQDQERAELHMQRGRRPVLSQMAGVLTEAAQAGMLSEPRSKREICDHCGDDAESRHSRQDTDDTHVWMAPGQDDDDELRAPLLQGEADDCTVVEEPPVVPSTFAQSVFNSVNLLMGVGILSLPYAFRLTGWVVGTVLLVLICLMTRHTAVLLARCMDVNPAFASYGDAGGGAFGGKGRVLISLVFMIELATASVALIILTADSIESLFPHWDDRLVKLGVFLVFAPSTWGRSLAHLSFTSALGIFTIVTLLAILVGEGLARGNVTPGSLRMPAHTSLWPQALAKVPLCIGLIAAGFSGHAVYPSIYRQMRHPSDFGKVVNTSYAITAALMLAFSVAGYVMFGDATMAEISQNLPRIPAYPRPLAVLTILIVMINPFTKYALTFQPVCVAVEGLAQLAPQGRAAAQKCPNAFRIACRTLLTALSALVAILLPNFDRVMSLLGSLFSMTVCIIVPTAMYIKFFHHSMSWWSLILNGCLCFTGVILALIGTVCGLLF